MTYEPPAPWGPPPGGRAGGSTHTGKMSLEISVKNRSDCSDCSGHGAHDLPAPCGHPYDKVYHVRPGVWACAACGSVHHHEKWHPKPGNGEPEPRQYIVKTDERRGDPNVQ